MREQIAELVERAWDNGVVDCANRESESGRRLCLAFTSGKIEGSIPSITDQILSSVCEEIEKVENPYPEDRYHVSQRIAYGQAHQDILALLREVNDGSYRVNSTN